MSNSDLKKIYNYRKEMNSLDSELFTLLKKRIQLSQKIMKFKKQIGLPLQDYGRESEIEAQLLKKLGIRTDQKRAHGFIKALMRLNIKYPATR